MDRGHHRFFLSLVRGVPLLVDSSLAINRSRWPSDGSSVSKVPWRPLNSSSILWALSSFILILRLVCFLSCPWPWRSWYGNWHSLCSLFHLVPHNHNLLLNVRSKKFGSCPLIVSWYRSLFELLVHQCHYRGHIHHCLRPCTLHRLGLLPVFLTVFYIDVCYCSPLFVLTMPRNLPRP